MVILPFLRSGSKPFPSDRYVDIFICNLEFYCFQIKFVKCRKCQLKQTGYFPKRAEPFSFRCAEFASFFAGRKAEQTFFSDFNTPCDSSRIRANRTWLIAKTARCARSFEFLIVRLYTQSAESVSKADRELFVRPHSFFLSALRSLRRFSRGEKPSKPFFLILIRRAIVRAFAQTAHG